MDHCRDVALELHEANVIAQNDELEVIDVSLSTPSSPPPTNEQAIYPSAIETLPNPTGKPGRLLHLSIPISLPTTSLCSFDTANGASSSSVVHLSLDHLPPMSVRLLLPATYPANEPPRCLSIKSSIPDADHRTAWLDRSALSSVQRRIAQMWAEDKAGSDEGAGVIWKWWDWIGTGEFLADLKYSQGDSIR